MRVQVDVEVDVTIEPLTDEVTKTSSLALGHIEGTGQPKVN